MEDIQFRAFLDLLMCCDPWPVDDGGENMQLVKSFAINESIKRGYSTWIEAYHEFNP